MATNQGFKSLIPGEGLDEKYLYHWLSSHTSLLQSLGNGATFKEISKRTVESIELPLPSLGEQRRIAAILDQARELQAVIRRAMSVHEQLLTSVFHASFDGDDMVVPFSGVCRRITVGVVVKPASYYVDDNTGVPALRTLNVRPGKIDLSDIVYFSKESSNGPLSKSILSSGDLVVARTGRPGTAAIIPPELDGSNAIDLIIVTPNTDVASPLYLQAFLNSDIGRRMVIGQSRGQIQQHFNVGSLKKSLVPIPSLAKQELFADRVREIEKQRSRIERLAEANDGLVASLQDRAFRGEL